MECIHCGSAAATKNGSFRPRGGGERVQRYSCKDCGQSFSDNTPQMQPVKRLPDGQRLKGISEYVRTETGGQWIKTDVDEKRREEAARAALDALTGELDPYPPSEPCKRETRADLASVYIVTDYHLGMRAWPHETRGEPWDVKIAEQMLVRFFEEAIALSPPAHTAVLCNLGDFLHWDGLESVTPASGHNLDHDDRFEKLAWVAIRVIRRVIGMLLEAHEHVRVIMAEGNHDPASSAWLRQTFSALFDDEPRVKIDHDHDTYYAFEWGETSVYFHHGHKRKPTNVDTVFAAKFRELWGRTRHSYAHMGHLHHQAQIETNLMVVEQHRTLASPDSYASRGGWMSGRSAPVITYHKKHGEVARHTLTPEMLD